MKKSIKIISLVGLLQLSTIFGCNKGWIDVNYNPKQLTEQQSTPDELLAPVEISAADRAGTYESLMLWMGYWAPPYLVPSAAITSYQNISISGYIPDQGVALLESRATTLNEDFYIGIAKTLRALAFTASVDCINNMPYSEAFNINIVRPKYDSGQFIYEDAMKQLTVASGLIKGANLSANKGIATADIIFHGNQLLWLQFINTIKLRLLIHQTAVANRASYIAAEIKVITDEGSGFLSIDAGVNPGFNTAKSLNQYFGLFDIYNPYAGVQTTPRLNGYDAGSSTGSAHANIYALNLLKNNSDPRLGFFYSPVDQPLPAGALEPFPQVQPPSNYRGSQFGLAINTNIYHYQEAAYLSAVGGAHNTGLVTPQSAGIIKGADMSDWIITSVESRFLQAEAIYRAWLPGDPEQAYKTAVNESFRWLNVGQNTNVPALSDAVFNQWYNAQVAGNNPNVAWASAPDKYKLIMFQKYLSLNGIDALQTWDDYRRNGRYPDLPVSADPSRVANTIPIRLLYPLKEATLNPVNLAAQGHIDMFTGKIWWMAN